MLNTVQQAVAVMKVEMMVKDSLLQCEYCYFYERLASHLNFPHCVHERAEMALGHMVE